jgi:two-component system, OmpR family, phosphate regulon response regulator PhoB
MDSPRVLIVDDFEDLRNLVAFFLGARGYKVLEAANRRAAIQTAINEDPNFILLDLLLPGYRRTGSCPGIAQISPDEAYSYCRMEC